MAIFQNAILAGASGQGGAYQIERSLRFNSADSAYLGRTPAGAGSLTTTTLSFWMKISTFGTFRGLFAVSTVNDSVAYLRTGNDLIWDVAGSAGLLLTTQLFRDPTAWYHIVFVWDSTNATANDRMRMYLNGQQITSFANRINPPQNTNSNFNSATAHRLGALISGSYSDGYMTEVNFIDGQALSASSFGATNADTGAWDPKAYSGTFGSNGFYLKFADNSGTTATTLGKDSSGNSNNWTPNNFSVTAGAGNDSLTDTPTNYGTGTDTGGVMRGNYATFSSIYSGTMTISEGGLKLAAGSNSKSIALFPMSTGKWYFEVYIDSDPAGGGATGFNIGIATATQVVTDNTRVALYYGYRNDGNKWSDSAGSTAYGASWTTGALIGVAVDCDAGTLTFYKNNSSQGTAFSGINFASAPLLPLWHNEPGGSAMTVIYNFGQRAFAYTPPSGFLSLCTQNLAEGSITTSGTFTGNASADGPVVALNGVPTTMTINSNAVTFGTHADKLATGFKLRTSSGSYNTSGSNSYSVSATSSKFKYARAQANP